MKFDQADKYEKPYLIFPETIYLYKRSNEPLMKEVIKNIEKLNKVSTKPKKSKFSFLGFLF
ncbi:MAG: hypothetical protein HC836_45105 [Richelia sp. RM2_1_2]|nr:hypothetical protein [Richelia sp. RM2_1_2]